MLSGYPAVGQHVEPLCSASSLDSSLETSSDLESKGRGELVVAPDEVRTENYSSHRWHWLLKKRD